MKNLYEKDRYYSPKKLFEEFEFLTVIDSYKLYACSLIQSIKIKKVHSNTVINERNHGYATRNRNQLWTCKIHTFTWGENNPLRKAITYYNTISSELKQEINMKTFKVLLKKQFMNDWN